RSTQATATRIFSASSAQSSDSRVWSMRGPMATLPSRGGAISFAAPRLTAPLWWTAAGRLTRPGRSSGTPGRGHDCTAGCPLTHSTWRVVADLAGRAVHAIDLRSRFGPMPVAVDPALWARARVAAACGLLMRAWAPVPLKAEVHEGDVAPIQGWISPDYGQRRPAPVV